jgi:hypothetical protein
MAVSVQEFYPSEAAAEGFSPLLGRINSNTVATGTIVDQGSGYELINTNTRWLQRADATKRVYITGETIAYGSYWFYPAPAPPPCFREGTKILCLVEGADIYVPVETLRYGTLVKTSLNKYKPVELIGKTTLQNPGTDERIQNRLYKCSPANYPELTEDLYITGCHSILVDSLTNKEQEETIKQMDRVFVTDKKYRLIAAIDERAVPWNSEESYTIWHFALEHSDPKMNYGVYANGGLLVESCCIDHLKNKSTMTLVRS